jgi:hypothetical protein
MWQLQAVILHQTDCTHPVSSCPMVRYTFPMLLLSQAKFSEEQLGKAATSCLARSGLWHGFSPSCSCLVRSRCCTNGWHSLRNWLQERAAAPADPCCTSLGSRYDASTSSFSCDRHRRKGDCWTLPAAAGPCWTPCAEARAVGMTHGLPGDTSLAACCNLLYQAVQRPERGSVQK